MHEALKHQVPKPHTFQSSLKQFFLRPYPFPLEILLALYVRAIIIQRINSERPQMVQQLFTGLESEGCVTGEQISTRHLSTM